jgi:hypothetical protein
MAADQDWLDLTDKENVGFKYTTWGFCSCDNKYHFGNYYGAMLSERNVTKLCDRIMEWRMEVWHRILSYWVRTDYFKLHLRSDFRQN